MHLCKFCSWVTGVSNDDLGLSFEQSDQMVKMSSWTCRILKIINFEIFNPGLLYKGDFATKRGIFEPKISFLAAKSPILYKKSPGLNISKLMILSILHVHELIFTIWNLCSTQQPKSSLETPVEYLFKTTLLRESTMRGPTIFSTWRIF